MHSLTFKRTHPPTIGRETIAVQCLQIPDFKIYVPDDAVATYKAVSNLSSFSNYIVGESERPTYNITLNLTNCTASNNTEISSDSYGNGYNIYSNGKISLPTLTGDVVITITAVAE